MAERDVGALSGTGARVRALGRRLSTLPSVLPILVFLGLFSLAPLVVLLTYSLAHLGGAPGLWGVLWGPGEAAMLARRALANSFEQGFLSAGLALLWGFPAGVYLGLRSTPWKLRIRGFLVLPFLLPSLVMVFGVFSLFGATGLLGGPFPGFRPLSTGLAGILWVNVLYNAPVIALYTAAALEGVPRHLEEAARVLGASPVSVFRTVWLRPAILGAFLGAVLTFILSFLGFAPPLLIGGPAYYTLEDWIYALDKMVGFQGPAMAAGIAVWGVAIMALPMAIYMLLLRDTNLLGRGPGTTSPPLRSERRPTLGSVALGGITGALLISEAALLASVVLLSVTSATGGFSGADWTALGSSRVSGALQVSVGLTVFNTLFFALVSAAVVFALALPLYSSDERGSRWWGGFSFLPLLISPVILALGLELAWGRLLGSPSLVWVLIVVSQASIALPLALQGLGLSFRSLPPSLAGAARTLGASRFRAFSDVRLPLARPGVQAALLLTLAVGLGEFAATNFLFIPRFTTLTVMIYLLQDLRMPGPSLAVAALLVLVSVVLFGVFSMMQRAPRARSEVPP